MLLPQTLSEKIKQVYDDLSNKGEILSKSPLDSYLKAFRDRFGPDVLNNLDGEALVDTMHNQSNQDSLVYWLEFKNDDEFPSPAFGSIAGGSALKFGIYRRKETGAWTTGSPNKQREIELYEAVSIAKKHRDQIAKGVSILEQLPENPSDSDYLKLQNAMA